MNKSERKREKAARAAIGEVTAKDLKESMKKIVEYAKPYVEIFSRSEQGGHFVEMMTGFTSNLERKSAEPIAVMHGLARRPIQHFVGGSKWPWEPLMKRERQEVAQEIGIEDGSLVLDGSATPKKGTATVGVKRQWCGRLGKQDNCVIGVYGSYVGRNDATALVAAELYLPEEWVKDTARREAAFVPTEVVYRTQPEIARDIVTTLAGELPFMWIMGDDEFGRCKAFRDHARELGKSYIVDVPKNTVVRHVRKGTVGRLPKKRRSVEKVVRHLPTSEWSTLHVRDGEKGPVMVRAAMLPVKTERGACWIEETFVVIETLDGKDRWYCLAHAAPGTTLLEFVRRAGIRHRIEETFEEAKGEVGLDHFEVRSWHGWYHHMTMGLIAHWFLLREKRRLGKKSGGSDHQHDPHGDWISLLSADAGTVREHRELPPDAERGGAPSAFPCAWSGCTAPPPCAMN
ncbi:MAG: IS701 family transposase [Planctomycetota bacterium]